MGDMGLVGMGGAAGAGDALQNIFQERLQAAAAQRQQQQLEQNDALLRIKAQEHADEVQQNLELKRQTEKDRVDAAKASQQTRLDKQASDTFTMNPIGANLGPTQGPRAQQLGFPVQQIAGPKVQQTTGFMPLPSAPSQGPGMQPMGDLSPVGGAPAVGPQIAPGASTTATTQMPDTFQRGATQADMVQQQGAADKVEAARVAAENRTNDNEQKAKDRLAQIAAAAAARPVPDKLTKVEHKGPDGRTIIEWKPQSELRGQTFDKGVSGATETRLASAQAVSQTGEDIIAKLSDPKVAAMVGPAMGRYNSVRDWIGDPPPELSELAGALESYAIANMGVHGMRSVQGADQIKKLLDKKHTPDSMISTIKGLNSFSQHFMQNEGRGGATTPAPAGASATGAPPAPDGWKYVPKPGGGWTAVKATP